MDSIRPFSFVKTKNVEAWCRKLISRFTDPPGFQNPTGPYRGFFDIHREKVPNLTQVKEFSIVS